MLGTEIRDPRHAETGGSSKGLGLLEIHTELMPQKKTVQVRAHPFHVGADFAGLVEGYEIHMGVTTLSAGMLPCFEIVSQENVSPSPRSSHETEASEFGILAMDGAMNADGRVWGTYIHGVFDQPGFRRQWLNRVRGRKHLAPLKKEISEDVTFRLTRALDRWADHVAQHCHVTRIFSILGV
jgi:adenosylcobyric acid synthase